MKIYFSGWDALCSIFHVCRVHVINPRLKGDVTQPEPRVSLVNI